MDPPPAIRSTPFPRAARENTLPLSEVVGALSLALDLTEGQPSGHAARACLIGMRLADALGLEAAARSDLYYALLLKDAGCSSNAAATAEFFGTHDHGTKRSLKSVDWSRPLPAFLFALRTAAAGRGLRARIAQLREIRNRGEGAAGELFRIRCERGAEIVRKMEFPEATAAAVRALDEHWDGGGEPDGLQGREIPLYSRIAQLAQTVEVFATGGTWDEALEVAKDRSGTWFDPELVGILCALDKPGWWSTIQGPGVLDHLPVVEPEERIRRTDEDGIDRVAEGFAEVVDAKSPFTFRHSSRVADVASDVARELGMSPHEIRCIYRAGLLHDIGKLGVSNRILDKDGPLTTEEWAVVRSHPTHTWTILSQVGVFQPIARTAAVHHERLDGTGYPWGIGARGLGRADRILAAADIYEALTSDRPYRKASSHEDAMRMIRELAGDGLDPEVVEALSASAHDPQQTNGTANANGTAKANGTARATEAERTNEPAWCEGRRTKASGTRASGPIERAQKNAST